MKIQSLSKILMIRIRKSAVVSLMKKIKLGAYKYRITYFDYLSLTLSQFLNVSIYIAVNLTPSVLMHESSTISRYVSQFLPCKNSKTASLETAFQLQSVLLFLVRLAFLPFKNFFKYERYYFSSIRHQQR